MKQPVFCTAGETPALRHARKQLLQWGYTFSPTHQHDATHLLLPVPSLDPDGRIKGGPPLEELLQGMPENVTVLGGNLPPLPCRHEDFLKDPYYLEENAAITAQCTITLLQRHSQIADQRILIIGWGRIGKQLAALLQPLGAAVTVAARQDRDLQSLEALGYRHVWTKDWNLSQYHIIINTAPAPLLDESETHPEAMLVDLASVRGISGRRVIWARGLPNQEAPDASGILIAKTALRYALGKESL